MTQFIVTLFAAIVTVGSLLPNTSVLAKSDLVTDEEIEALIPEPQAGEDVVHLGKKFSWRNLSFVDGYAIIHYKKNESRREARAQRRASRDCYGFLANGAKWKTVEDWVMNTSNTEGLDGVSLFANMSNNVSKWEDAADGLVNGSTINIMGNGSTTTDVLVADTSSPDNKNEVLFGSVSNPGAIAVTIVWGVFGGPSSRRQLVEWDMVFDQTDFNWSLSGDLSTMDFENIATHELGHAFGLSDLYNSCIQETMYGYADEGEIQKRDLNAGDILGISTLY